ncbi:secreted antigen 1 [Babesia divergens]|uniref:Secreted antigen 1 n=1 Tax=Babesia divergens TaxID=32595 RepID=A0AAD9GEW4_BABDI|nr:secreted antigen 1 [Babesia divergens]
MKNMLNFIESLSRSDIKDGVLEKVESKVNEYVDTKAAPGGGITQHLDAVFKRVSKLCDVLLQMPSDYGMYTELQTSEDFIDKYANTLADWLPVLSCELSFLYFQVAAECNCLAGGKWSSLRFGKAYSNSELHLWLTDQIGEGSDFGLIERGFAEEDIPTICRAVEIDASLGIDFFQGCPFSHSQYGMFFLGSTWHDSNLANATLFLERFCQDIKEGKFKANFSDESLDRLLSICKKVSFHLVLLSSFIWPMYNPRISELGAPLVGSLGLYKDALKPENLEKYADWLVKNIPHIMASIQQMHAESVDWCWSGFYNSKTAGPFKYGFVFKDRHWYDSLSYSLFTPVEGLLEGLRSLRRFFDCVQVYPEDTADYERALLRGTASE